MATVVITFFLFTRISVCKMDADFKEKRRERYSSQREKRWSMNSQRLEEIVAELMRPIGDLRHSFDTDLSALLEEYLTEAGLRALEAEDGLEAGAAGDSPAPNFPELALLLQQSACIYGRKVDALYQHVLTVSETLHNSTLEITNSTTEEEPQTPSTSRRKRKASVNVDFSHIEVSACGAARRSGSPPRPPPTLPRLYMELEPRVMAPHDVPLRDYNDEPIGLLTDFHVSWRLQDGQLVDELERDATRVGLRELRAIPLLELQAAIAAHAPPDPPPPPHEPSPPPGAPPHCSTPLPADMPPPAPLPPLKKERKRKNDTKIDDVVEGSLRLVISKELGRKLMQVEEFSVPREWLCTAVSVRRAHILALRARLGARDTEFKGFDFSCLDVSGFAGWSGAEACAAAASARRRGARPEPADSDDDGFFEQSSLGDSDASRADDSPAHTHTSTAEWVSWREGVVRRAAAREARGGVDVRALAGAVLRALPAPPRAAPFAHVLAARARDHADVSTLFLATLFLANAGNVELIQGAPLSVDSFSLRLVTADEALYGAVADAEGLPDPPR